MRFYFDTNILVFLLTGQSVEVCPDVRMLLEDYGNTFFTSSICVQELIHIAQIGKVRGVDPTMIISWLDEANIKIVPPTEKNLQTLSELPMQSDHRDPYDRLIIAQAISDKIPLISSDRKFALYGSLGLDFVFNER